MIQALRFLLVPKRKPSPRSPVANATKKIAPPNGADPGCSPATSDTELSFREFRCSGHNTTLYIMLIEGKLCRRRIYIHMHTYVRTYIVCIYINKYINTHTHIYIYIYAYAHAYTCVYICIYIHICTHSKKNIRLQVSGTRKLMEQPITLGIKIAQKPYIVWSLAPKALIYESLDP